LGDARFAAREEASKRLWEAGSAAEAALREATKSKDPEVARRARDILDEFNWGIYPDVPAKVVELIQHYQGADWNGKIKTAGKLVELGPAGCEALVRIAAAESNTDVLGAIRTQIARDRPGILQRALLKGDFDTLEALLAVGLAGEVKTGITDSIAYWTWRGKLDEQIARYKALAGKGAGGKKVAKVLAYLYRAKGDLVSAGEAAAKADQPDLVKALLYEHGNWKELARLPPAEDEDENFVTLGYRAAYCRLAGCATEFEATVASVLRCAAEDDKNLNNYFVAKILLINDRPREALDLLTKRKLWKTAFTILCSQLRFREALELVDKARAEGDEDLPELEILAARTLYGLGEKDKALSIFAG
jgi:hypothetical protein